MTLNDTATPSAEPISRPPSRAARVSRVALRVLMVVQTVLLALQVIFAGGFMNGSYSMLSMHHENANFGVPSATLFALIAAVVWWRAGGGPGKLPIVLGGLIVLEGIQSFLGLDRLLLLHVPLGVVIMIGGVQTMSLAFEETKAAAAAEAPASLVGVAE